MCRLSRHRKAHGTCHSVLNPLRPDGVRHHRRWTVRSFFCAGIKVHRYALRPVIAGW